MEYLPLHFDLKSRLVLLVGGGEIALRKARLLASAGALLRVVAPAIQTELSQLVTTSGGRCLYERYRDEHLEGVYLVVSATDQRSVNEQVFEDADRRFLPCNVVDTPDLCTVIFPAIVDRTPVTVSISSGGASPVLTRLLREQLEKVIPEGVKNLGTYLRDQRQALKTRLPDPDTRRKLVEAFVRSPAATALMAGDTTAADNFFAAEKTTQAGEVFLVGAGPGDPDLLTIKALQILQSADTILYDNLVSAAILDRARRDAKLIYVGKKRADHSIQQEDLNMLLVNLAKQGKRVLRLKGGDPFVFGRGGEEIEKLAEHNVPFQVVPGITAATGCASYAGIPLTHRDYAQSVRFVTGHPKDGQLRLPWQEFVHTNQTLVFYMGLVGLKIICDQLISHGRLPDTPAALISRGTLPDQKVIVGSLATLPDQIESEPVPSPTLIIVGDVVMLRERLGVSR